MKNGDIGNVFQHEKVMGNVLGSLCDISVFVVNDFYSTGIRLNFVIKLGTCADKCTFLLNHYGQLF